MSAISKRIAELEAEILRMQNALLRRVQHENDCGGLVGKCTGWSAEECECALEARSIFSAVGEAETPDSSPPVGGGIDGKPIILPASAK
jgi:hypothetical protein